MKKKIIVASKNPVKINTTEIGFQRMFPNIEFEIEGVSVPSDVPAQPSTDEETLLGAQNRAKNARNAITKADYWVGIEGGIEDAVGGMESFAWVVIQNQKGLIGKGRTGTFIQPEEVAKHIRKGKELGDADDMVFGLKNSKQANGSIGILTGDVLTRTTFLNCFFRLNTY